MPVNTAGRSYTTRAVAKGSEVKSVHVWEPTTNKNVRVGFLQKFYGTGLTSAPYIPIYVIVLTKAGVATPSEGVKTCLRQGDAVEFLYGQWKQAQT